MAHPVRGVFLARPRFILFTLWFLHCRFRWNYLEQIPDRLGGFEQFVTRGVRAEWVNGVFPTLSYPSWTTLGTGSKETNAFLINKNNGARQKFFH